MTEIVFGYKILLDWYKELEREHKELTIEDNNWRVMRDEGYVYYCTTIKELDTTGSTVTPGAIDPLEGKTYCVTVLALKQLTGDTAARWYSKVFAVTIKR